MKANMGTADRIIRILIAIVIGVLWYTEVISGTLAIILGIVAIAFIATSFMRVCPMYLPFGLSTLRKKS
jgi:hypothetical protein